MQWDRALLPRLLELVREVEPGVEVDWDARDAITLRVPGVEPRLGAVADQGRPQGWICRFLGKKGQFNLSRVEGFGVSPAIDGEREDGDVLRLVFQHAEPSQAAKLKELLAEHLRGFREAFGKGDATGESA